MDHSAASTVPLAETGETMGINISGDNFVAHDQTHEKRVNTSLDANPTSKKLGGVTVHHVFRRNKTGDLDRDGNPLIYALKGMGGYNIVAMYRTQIMARAREILEKCTELQGTDYVMPMPSSYGFSEEFAQMVCQVTGTPYLGCGFLRKKTVAEMLAQYGDSIPKNLGGQREKDYKSQMHTWRQMKPGQLASMKEIGPKIRRYFDPFEVGGGAPDISGKNVLVVDDIMSSGASLSAMIELLTAKTGCKIDRAACFLSGL
ncbi:MAG: hypothetical protein BGN84_17925 [Afipia sp. 62-7]|nr:MAG: hypothetical protein BGN84_17925 [Afipia sp. 62-7]